MGNRRISELAGVFVRLKLANMLTRENEMTLDPGPASQSPEPKERKIKKAVRRVFPFKRRKESGFVDLS